MSVITHDLNIVIPRPQSVFPLVVQKRLRSCLSPVISRTASPAPLALDASSTEFSVNESGQGFSSTATSRSTSFSFSETGYKRSKSVHWDGPSNGYPVTCYFDTYSATEYDRTPLDAPTQQERSCVLPERGSRSFTQYSCFDEEDQDCAPSPITVSPLSSPVLEGIQASLLSLHRDPVPLSLMEEDEEEEEEEVDEESREAQEDRDWEECMERRRLMFARMSSQDDEERHPEFDGYRSISSTLADLLSSVGCPLQALARARDTVNANVNLDVEGTAMGITPSSTPLALDMASIIIASSGAKGIHEDDDAAGSKTPSLVSASNSTAGSEEIEILSTPQARVPAFPLGILTIPEESESEPLSFKSTGLGFGRTQRIECE